MSLNLRKIVYDIVSSVDWYICYCLRSLFKKLHGSFLCKGFKHFKTAKPLLGDSLLLNIKSPGVPGSNLTKLRKIKCWVDLGTTIFIVLTEILEINDKLTTLAHKWFTVQTSYGLMVYGI